MDEASTNNPKPQHKRRILLMLYVVAVAVLVAVALQVHSMRNPQSPSSPRPMSGLFPATLPAMSFLQRGNPSDLAAGVEGQSGLVPISEDPMGLVPPTGAKRQWAFRESQTGVLVARYSVQGEISPVAELYRTAMQGRKFRLCREAVDKFGWHRLDFIDNNSGQSASVALRNDGRDAKIVIVQVTVFSPLSPPRPGLDRS